MVPPDTQTVNRILVGSDLSTASDRVIIAASRLARSIGAELHVISAYATAAPAGFAGANAPEIDDAVRQEVSSALPSQLRRILSADDAPASAEVRFGRASEVLLTRATELSVDLIVIGAHRGPEVDAQFLGTTADEVLRGTSVPCLVIHGGMNLPMRRVAVAMDREGAIGGGASRAAVLAAALTGPGEAPTAAHLSLVVLTVRESAAGEASEDSMPLDFTDSIGETLARSGVESCDVDAQLMVDGDPADAIEKWVSRNEVDLVVVGTRRRGRSPGSLGSTASAITRRIPAPVLLIPPEIPAT